MNHILDVANPGHAIQMAPIFGRINVMTLFQLHQQGFHPVCLYSPEIKSNTLTVHESTPGPLLVLLHDFFHIAKGNRLPKNEYDFLFSYFLPAYSKFFNLTGAEISNAESSPSFPVSNLFAINDLLWHENDLRSILEILLRMNFHPINLDNMGETWVVQYQALLEDLIKNKDKIRRDYNIDISKLLGPAEYQKVESLEKRLEYTKALINHDEKALTQLHHDFNDDHDVFKRVGLNK